MARGPAEKIRKTEREVTAEILKEMIRRGWRPRRSHSGLFYTRDGRPQRIGEPGMCDWVFLRNSICPMHYCEVEIKASGKKPSPQQLEYMAAMNHAGIACTWVDSVEELTKWLQTLGV